MLIQKKPKLNLYKKLEILQLLLDNEPFVYSLDELNEQEIIEAQNFIWEKTLEFGIRIKRDDFSKEEILKDIKSNKEFHKEKQCKEPLSKCDGFDCLYSNKACAMEKIELQINAMSDIIKTYLKDFDSSENNTTD